MTDTKRGEAFGAPPLFHILYSSIAILFPLPTRNSAVTATARASAATVESQMPSRPQSNGRISTARHWNTSVRRKEIRAEVNPSFRAVKKEEPKMAIPENRKEKENMAKARTVMFISSGSYPTNSRESGRARVCPAANISRENTPINTRLLRSSPLPSS